MITFNDYTLSGKETGITFRHSITDNDMIDTDEFQGAPFLFGRKFYELI